MALGYFVLALVFLAVIVAFGSIKIVPQGHEFTVQRFGRYTRTLKLRHCHPHAVHGRHRAGAST